MSSIGPSTLIGRLVLAVGATLLIGNAALLSQLHGEHRSEVERSERARLQSAASLIAETVDIETQQVAIDKHPVEDHFMKWQNASPEAVSLHQELASAAQRLGVSAPILTARLPERSKVAVASDPRSVHKNALEIIATSEATPRWRHPLDFRPEMLPTLLHGDASATGIYEGLYGEKISAYAPLLDAEGAPVGMVVLETDPASLEAALDSFFVTEMSTMAATGCLVLLAIGGLIRRTLNELAAFEEATTRLGEGDFDTPIPTSDVAEVSRLSRGLELARRQLARQVTTLTERSDGLEHKLAAAQLQIDPRVLERRERIADTDTQISAGIEVTLGERLPCTLVDLGYEEAVIRVPQGSPIDLAAGMPATLSVRIDGDDPVNFRAVTALRLDQGDELEYRLELLDPLRDYEGIPSGLVNLLNTRGAFRVFPSNHAPVLVDMQSRDGGFLVADAAVENISETGLAVRVPQSPAIVATWGTRLALHMTLPGHVVPIEFEVLVRNVADSMGGARLGLAFDLEAQGFKQKQEHIADYVVDRQREMQTTRLSLAA